MPDVPQGLHGPAVRRAHRRVDPTLRKADRDGYELFLRQLLETNLSGTSAMTLVRVAFDSLDDHDICRVDVAGAARPVFVRPQGSKEATEFYARIGNATKPLSGEDMAAYQREHWG